MKTFLLLFATFILCDKPKTPVIVPIPREVQYGEGFFTLDSDTGISYDSSFDNLSFIASYARDWILGATQFYLKILPSPMNVGIVFDTPNEERNGFKSMDSEEYSLTITNTKVLIVSSSYAGFLYGFTTYLQLLPEKIYNLDPDIECRLVDTEECREYDWEPNRGVEWSSPCVTIKDKPSFGYRGVMLDTSRHFFSVDIIKRLLRVMAILKLNHFQMHLTDDPGNRFESLKYPGFQTIGSIRKSSPKPWASGQSDGKQYGPYYYTQDQLRDIVAYAGRLGIEVVPEFELPGHALGALAPYYKYSCRQEPLEVACFWGSSIDVFCPGNDETIEFLENVLEEVMGIFPSKYIHIGCDEVNKARWSACPKCQARIKAEGLANVNELQGWLVSHFSNFIDQHGRKLVGWGEILSGSDISKNAIVMNWQGIMAAVDATKKGHNTIDDSNRHFYYNYKQFPGDDIYEYNSPADFVPFWYTYQKDPYFMIEEENRGLVLGVQAAAWAEFIWGGEPDLHYKLFPRTLALSETGWSTNSSKDWNRFYSGYVRVWKQRLHYLGISPAPLMLYHELSWSKENITADGSFNVISWNVTKSFNRDCSYDVTFIKTGGSKDVDLRIRNIKILVDGKELVSLPDEKVASFNDDGKFEAFWRFELTEKIPNGKEVKLQAEVAGKGGNDCEGVVAVYATEFKSPYPTP